MTIRILYCLFACGCALWHPGPARAERMLTTDEAKEIVRRFAGKKPDYKEHLKLRNFPGLPDPKNPGKRILFTLNDTRQNIYAVDNAQRTVVHFSTPDAHRGLTGKEEAVWKAKKDIPKAQTIQYATTFAQRHYKGFTQKKMRFIKAEPSSYYWDVSFNQVLPTNRARTENFVSVRLSRKENKVLSYGADYSPDLPPEAHRTPKINKRRAEEIIAKSCARGYERGFRIEDLHLFCDRKGDLTWRGKTSGLPYQGYSTHYLVSIHADTGKIIQKGGCMCTRGPL